MLASLLHIAHVGAASAQPDVATSVVNTTLGLVRGYVDAHRTRVFRGIPFAAAPTGENRYRPPQPGVPWKGVRSAELPGFQCPQLGLLGHEDCLFLHVSVPSGCSVLAPCPVMFYVYGGGFILGDDGEYGFYAPAELARSQRAVVIATNYRLNHLGFLALPALMRESGTAGNWGMLDQRAALVWTQHNIRRFGGDPGAVTLFGESAGGMSVCWHLASAGSRGLFHRAIIESGLCALPAFFQPTYDAFHFASAHAAKVGCDATKLGTDAALLACLRALPAHALHTEGPGSNRSAVEALLAAGGVGGGLLSALPPSLLSVPPLSPLMDWGPVIDGVEMVEMPLEALRKGRGNYVPTIVGNNNDEGSLFVLLYPLIVHGTSLPPKPSDLGRAMRHIFGPGWGNSTASRAEEIAAAVEAEYLAVDYGGSEYWRNAAVLRDFIFACPARRLARALDTHGASVWRYRFAPQFCAEPSLSDAEWVDMQLLHCYHASELYSVWGHAWPDLPLLRQFGPRMRQVSKTVQAYWGSFAREGDPNSAAEALPGWPRFRAATAVAGGGGGEETQVLAEHLEIQAGYLADKCDFWDALCGPGDCFGPRS